MSEPIRIFLLEDHEIVRRGFRHLLEDVEDIVLVGEAPTAALALERLEATQPDVAVLDVRLPDGNGIDVCREIRSRHESVRCLVLTSYDDRDALAAAVLAGAAGFLSKQIGGPELTSAIRAVAAGQSLLDPAATAELLDRLHQPPQARTGITSLTEREREVLDLIADGLSNRQIGERLFLTEKTVKNYVSNLLTKLDLQRRTQAAVLVERLRQRGDPSAPL